MLKSWALRIAKFCSCRSVKCAAWDLARRFWFAVIWPRFGVGEGQLGRVINGMGEPIDGKGDIFASEEVPLYAEAGNPLNRPPIREPLSLGVRAIDSMITLGKGQRVGIMAGSGVGKSVLMGMMARSSKADVNVIAMVGERGREVREFIENTLGEEGLKRSVVVVATSDQSALIRPARRLWPLPLPSISAAREKMF